MKAEINLGEERGKHSYTKVDYRLMSISKKMPHKLKLVAKKVYKSKVIPLYFTHSPLKVIMAGCLSIKIASKNTLNSQ